MNGKVSGKVERAKSGNELKTVIFLEVNKQVLGRNLRKNDEEVTCGSISFIINVEDALQIGTGGWLMKDRSKLHNNSYRRLEDNKQIIGADNNIHTILTRLRVWFGLLFQVSLVRWTILILMY